MKTGNTDTLIRYGFILAGLYNLGGILIFSAGFTNERLAQWYPEVFSLTGQIGILLWGVAYLSVAHCYERVPLLTAVFALEKLLYTLTWVYWLSAHGAQLPELAQDSPITAVFFAVYGLGDLLSCVFFNWVCWRTLSAR